MADGSVAVTQKQLDDRLKSFDQKITEQISREIKTSRPIKWDLASVIGSVIAATILIFMFMNTKIEAVNTRIDSLDMSVNTRIDS